MTQTDPVASSRPLPDGAAKLRFPKLFVLALLLFLIDLIVPDFIPLADEIILGLVALMLGLVKKPRS